jgi:hypothetical protein
MTVQLASPPYTRVVSLPARAVADVLRERLPGVGVKKLHRFAEKHGAVPVSTPSAPLGEAELNTVGYVLSRYGGLSGRDLKILGRARIEHEWMRAYFAAADDPDDEIHLDSEVVSEWLAGARERSERPSGQDDPQRLRARLDR